MSFPACMKALGWEPWGTNWTPRRREIVQRVADELPRHLLPVIRALQDQIDPAAPRPTDVVNIMRAARDAADIEPLMAAFGWLRVNDPALVAYGHVWLKSDSTDEVVAPRGPALTAFEFWQLFVTDAKRNRKVVVNGY